MRSKVRVLIERFFSKVNILSPDECWEWKAGTFKSGYGAFFIDGNNEGAHRVSWKIHNGKIPEGLSVLHKCDNPLCVNPDHLFLGTQEDNMTDKVSKGRQSSVILLGELNGQAVLVESQVIEIRELYSTGLVSQQDIADYFGVSRSHISNIITGHKWRNSKPACQAVR